MAKLRNFQFYRNGAVQAITDSEEHNVSDLKSAYVYAETLFKNGNKHKEMLDGEILLYRFSYAEQIHTLVGVVHADGTETTSNRSLEVLANYDMLGTEISNEISAAINKLDATVSGGDGGIDVTVTQTDGKITKVSVTDKFQEIARTGSATDVYLENKEGLFQASTVEGALNEIATEINAMDLIATDVVALNEGKTALQAGKISETDGKIAVETAESLVEFNQAISSGNKVATMADVNAAQNNAKVDGQDAIVVTDTKDENDTVTGKVVSLKLADGEQVLSQDTNGLKTTLNLTYDSTAKAIKLWGISDETPIATVNATDFIKDGMLADAEIITAPVNSEDNLEDGHRYIKFTFKTYQQGQEGVEEALKVEYLDVEDLIDSYTAGNEWIEIDQTTNKISHKTPTGLTTGTFGANTADATADAAGESIEFKVPSFTVDAAGHITLASEKTIKVALPEKRTADSVTVSTIDGLTADNVQDALAELQGDIKNINAVEWSGDNEINVDNTQHTIKHTGHKFTPTTSENDSAVKSVVIPQLTVNDYGHVTAIDNKTFKIDFNVPTVSGTEGQIVVTPTEGTEDVNYTVSLAQVARIDNPTNEGTAGDPSTSSFADDVTKFTYVKEVKTDIYGRVTGIVTETVTEFFDAGTY